MGFLCDLLLLLLVINVWAVVREFVGSIEASISFGQEQIKLQQNLNVCLVNWQDIYMGYKSIRQLCQLVNKPLSPLILLYLTDSVVSLSIALDATIMETSSLQRVRVAVFLILQSAIFVLSADISRQVKLTGILIMHAHVLMHWLVICIILSSYKA